MIVKHIQSRLFATTSREWQIRENWDVCTDTSDKEGLLESRRPGLIPEMRSDHPEKSQRFIPKNTSWGILFLRLEGPPLHSQDGVFDSGYYTILCVQVTLLCTPRDRKSLLEILIC